MAASNDMVRFLPGRRPPALAVGLNCKYAVVAHPSRRSTSAPPPPIPPPIPLPTPSSSPPTPCLPSLLRTVERSSRCRGDGAADPCIYLIEPGRKTGRGNEGSTTAPAPSGAHLSWSESIWHLVSADNPTGRNGGRFGEIPAGGRAGGSPARGVMHSGGRVQVVCGEEVAAQLSARAQGVHRGCTGVEVGCGRLRVEGGWFSPSRYLFDTLGLGGAKTELERNEGYLRSRGTDGGY